MRCRFTLALVVVLSVLFLGYLAKTTQAQMVDPSQPFDPSDRDNIIEDIIMREYEQRAALAQAQQAAWAQAQRAAWRAAPKAFDNDGKGVTQQIKNVTRGIRNDGYTYVWARDGDWNYYQDSNGMIGAAPRCCAAVDEIRVSSSGGWHG